jgi:hypothetical protein
LYTCACGDSYRDNETEALGHDYGEWAVTIEPTCTENGTQTRVCSRDESHTESGEVDALGHDYGDWTVTVEPTCTEKGTQTRVCSRDANHTESGEVDALGHDYGEWEQTVAPSCTAYGENTRTCSRDSSHIETQSVDMIAHTPGDPITTIEPDCITPGGTETVCTVCGTSITTAEVPALGHDYSDEKVAATCQTPGYTISTCERCKDVAWSDIIVPNNHSGVGTCTECGEDFIATLKTWLTNNGTGADGAYGVVRAANAQYAWLYNTEKNQVAWVLNCSENNIDYRLILDVSEVDGEYAWVLTNITDSTYMGGTLEAATFTSTTETIPYSSPATTASDKSTMESFNKLATSFIKLLLIETENFLHGSHMSVENFGFTEIAKSLNHSYTVKSYEPSTCTEDGSVTLVCSTCGETCTLVIPALGHEVIDAMGDCARCDEIVEDDGKDQAGD